MIPPKDNIKVAYFCTEFGIDNDLPTYSGGLGVLAGDIISAAADQDFPMVGIGILYKGKQFIQHITSSGHEEKRDSEFDHDTSFLRPTTKGGKPVIITMPLENVNVKTKSYHLRLSENSILFFLSTDVDGNPQEWISDMDALYRGDPESQIRQQILLGIGGVKLLDTLSLKPEFYHINEGRPSFLIWELTLELMNDRNISFDEAWEIAKKKIVYTNHTLVAAGNPEYPVDLIKKWANIYAKKMKVDTDRLIRDGVGNSRGFSITRYALNISSKQSAVSRVHRDYLKKDYPEYNWISITNGVHLPRWQDSDFRRADLTDRQIWDLHMTKKRELVGTVKKRTGLEYNPDRLIIAWARRLAQYKQPKVVLANVERLKSILAKSDQEVQLLFAGNSHSGDPQAKSIIEEIIKIFTNELSGHAIFIPNYNISLANHLVSGSDVWLNTPKGNLEASGTSGMKAAANGVLNCTVIDGWTHEVNWEGIGWTLDPKNVGESFMDSLEKEIAPLYYKEVDGIPADWISRMKSSIKLSKGFSAEKVLEAYKNKLYL
ncbi:MAG: alpha-glucan family phosphorylase [Patescibacteria group bacterium]